MQLLCYLSVAVTKISEREKKIIARKSLFWLIISAYCDGGHAMHSSSHQVDHEMERAMMSWLIFLISSLYST